MFNFDWTVRPTDVIAVLAVGWAAITYAFKSGRIVSAIETMKDDITELKETGKVVAAAMTTMAVQKQQIERVEQDIRDMKRGVGYAQDHGATTVDREYR